MEYPALQSRQLEVPAVVVANEALKRVFEVQNMRLKQSILLVLLQSCHVQLPFLT